MENFTQISGNIVDVVGSQVYPGTLKIGNGKIVDIFREEGEFYPTYIIPGLVDAHIHIESSMLVPSEFARVAVVHGTVAVVSDPHEIANVLGIRGVRYMIENGRKVPFKFYFGVPSCVPATVFETAGAALNAAQIEELFRRDGLKFLSEMMNYPGVIQEEPEVLAKLAVAQKYQKPIDGHAPGLTGKELKKYVNAGISTDHEAFQTGEGLEKTKAGMNILIREGTAAKNFDELHFLIREHAEQCMFCCDDQHPDNLIRGHLNELIIKALNKGYDRIKVLRCATLNPVRHYGLDVGLLQKGDPADLAVIDGFENFKVMETYVNGRLVAKNGRSLMPRVKAGIINNFVAGTKKPADFTVKAQSGRVNVIEVIDGELVTNRILVAPKIENGYVISDPEHDILKITVVNRYQDVPPVVAFIKNFGLKQGAIASSVAHDSHNIVAVGVRDSDLARAVNLIVKNRGGLAVVGDEISEVLPLPVAGLMSIEGGFRVAEQYRKIAEKAKVLGSTLRDPFMTMSFMALLVIPELKISDKGLFDGKNFRFIELFEG